MKFRPAKYSDWEILLRWRNDPETRKQSRNTNTVSENTHKVWLVDIIPKKILFIVEEDSDLVGTIRLDDKELSWTVAPEHRGKGMGSRMVKEFADRMDTAEAYIKPGNIASIKIAEAAGMKLTMLYFKK